MNGAETTAMMNSIQQGLGRPIRKEEIEPFHGPCINLAKRFQHHLCSFITVVGSSSSNDGRTFSKFDLFLSPTTAFSAPKINEDLQSEHIRQRMEQEN